MKTKINHILPVLLLTAASGLTTVSCNDFLDKTPDNRTELNTDQKIAKLLVSAYPDVSPNELFELYSDNSDDSGPTYGYYQLSEKECYNWEDTKEEYQDTPNSLWGGYYGAISAANMALSAVKHWCAVPTAISCWQLSSAMLMTLMPPNRWESPIWKTWKPPCLPVTSAARWKKCTGKWSVTSWREWN